MRCYIMIELSNANTINIKQKEIRTTRKGKDLLEMNVHKMMGTGQVRKTKKEAGLKDFFFSNYYKIQTMLLVSQGLKLFWYLTNRVLRTRFWCINWVYCTRFPIAQQLSLTHYPHRPGNRAQRTRFSFMKIEPKGLGFV